MVNKLFLTGIIIFVLLTSIAYPFIPNTQAAGLTSQQKAISTLNNVVGLDTPKYNISINQESNDLYRDTLSRENIHIKLDAADSNVDTLCSFINGDLQMIYVSANEGSPRMNTLINSDVDTAQNFLVNYQTQNKGLYEQLNTLLTKTDATKNSSITIGNIKLDVTALEKDTTFQWTYIENGIVAPDKCVALRYNNGFLNYFVDNWNLYQVGSTKIKLSEKDAISIAMNKAQNYSVDGSEVGTIGGLKFNVTNAMVIETLLSSAVYAEPNKARSQDPLELYPMYNIWVSLDKFYPGNVYGFNVYIWADTKEVYYIHQRVSTIDPPAELVASATDRISQSYCPTANSSPTLTLNSFLDFPVYILIFIVVISLITPFYLSRQKKNAPTLLRLPKISCLKAGGIVLCLLILSPIISALSASPVAATNVGGASVWGAESIGSINSSLNPPESWRKTNGEVEWQRSTSAYIATLFANNGYISTNNQGVNNYGSNKGPVLDQIQYFESNYPRVAVVDFDHGNGANETDITGASGDEFHYLFEDNWGTREGPVYNSDDSNANQHAIYDSNIYEETVAGKTCFAFINTCNSAHVGDSYYGQYVSTQGLVDNSIHKARGMPFAWSHGIKVTATPNSTPPSGWMSRDGFSYADSGDFCFIGFELGSAALDQTLASSSYHYYYWVYHFFHYALEGDNSIHTALNLASHDTFSGSPNFDASPLSNSTGFEAIWPMFIDGQWNYDDYSVPNCHMRVYGNSYIKLYQPLVNFSAVCNTSGHENDVLYPQFAVGGETHYCGNQRLIGKTYSVSVAPLHNYLFSYFSFNGQNYAPGNIPLTSDGNLVAHYIWYPVYYPLTISSSGSGSTSLSGVQSCL
ncbi:MAG: hypothetical protein NWE93_05850, partial [Candidatus Bathyarchaeota archaeon]|nr:hypothetical protein [Candidatus Bathyarchaeota archaeon]